MIHKGWNDPRDIVGEDGPELFIGKKYYCGKCERRILATNPAVLAQLPPDAQVQFKKIGGHFTHKHGIKIGMLESLRILVAGGFPLRRIEKLWKEKHMILYFDRKRVYEEHEVRKAREYQNNIANMLVPAQNQQQIPPFPEYLSLEYKGRPFTSQL